MAKPANIDHEPLTWNTFVGQEPAKAMEAIYQHVMEFAVTSKNWYWYSIRRKRLASLTARTLSLIVATAGVVLPLAATLWASASDKMDMTQLGVIALAAAGAFQLVDKVVGWSSGWLRYVSTVTTMEGLTGKFQLDWAGLVLDTKGAALTSTDAKSAFDVAAAFESQISNLIAKETEGWMAEFNSGVAALDTVIKASRETADKLTADLKTANEQKSKDSLPGVIEVTITPRAQTGDVYRVKLGDGTPRNCSDVSCVMTGVAPGLHRLVVESGRDDKFTGRAELAVQVAPAAVTKAQVALT